MIDWMVLLAGVVHQSLSKRYNVPIKWPSPCVQRLLATTKLYPPQPMTTNETASHVVEPMHLPTHRSLLGEERVVNLLDTAELAKVLQTVTGVCGAMAYSCKVGAAPERAEQIKAIVEGVLARTLEVFSLWVPGSEVGRINQAPRAEPVELSEDMSDVLQAVEKLFAVTKGMYDPACYPLMRYYQKHLTAAMRGFDEMPSGDPQATAIAQYAHWGSFILSKDGRTLTKTHDGRCVLVRTQQKGLSGSACSLLR